MKKIVLFDIDYTLSDRMYLRNFGRKYLARLVGQKVDNINPVVDAIIQESNRCFQIFDIFFYAKRIAAEYQNRLLEQKIIDMFLIYYPYGQALYPEVKRVLKRLKQNYILGIQSDGQEIFQLKKIEPIRQYFNKNYIFIFKNKTDEIYEKIKSYARQLVVVDDKPMHIQKLAQRGIRAILVKRGIYAAQWLHNPQKFPAIKEIVETLDDLINLL